METIQKNADISSTDFTDKLSRKYLLEYIGYLEFILKEIKICAESDIRKNKIDTMNSYYILEQIDSIEQNKSHILLRQSLYGDNTDETPASNFEGFFPF